MEFHYHAFCALDRCFPWRFSRRGNGHEERHTHTQQGEENYPERFQTQVNPMVKDSHFLLQDPWTLELTLSRGKPNA